MQRMEELEISFLTEKGIQEDAECKFEEDSKE